MAQAPVAARTQPPPIIPLLEVSGYARTSGFDNVPDTYFLDSFARNVKRIGIRDMLFMHVTGAAGDAEEGASHYVVRLGPVRTRNSDIVEFWAESDRFAFGYCYVQVDLCRARVSKFPLVDVFLGRQSLTSPIPPRRIFTTSPLSRFSDSNEGVAQSARGIEIRISKELKFVG